MQIKATQALGLKYGRKTGINNQSKTTKELLTYVSVWAYKNDAAKNTNETYVFISPKESVIEVFRALDRFFPDTIPIKDNKKIPAVYKVFQGERPQMYGWRIVDRLIRSEFENGYLNFVENNPNSRILLEEELFSDLQVE